MDGGSQLVWMGEMDFVPRDSGVRLDHARRVVVLHWGGAPYEIEWDRIKRPEDLLWWLHHVGEKAWPGMTGENVTRLIERVASLKGWALYEDFISEHQAPPAKEDVAAERAKMSPGMRWDILRRDGWRCRACGFSVQDGARLHVDHIKPVAKGGETVPKNLQTLCSACNIGKAAR